MEPNAELRAGRPPGLLIAARPRRVALACRTGRARRRGGVPAHHGRRRPVRETSTIDGIDDDDMRRRAFLQNAGVVAAAIALPGSLYAGTESPGRSDAGATRSIRDAVSDLYARDQEVGSVSLAAQAMRYYLDARHMLDEADYDERTGAELMSITGELAVCVGWLSYVVSSRSVPPGS